MVLRCQCRLRVRAAAGQFHSAAARVAAVAAVHQQLRRFDDVGTVELDRYVTNLCMELAAAYSTSEAAGLIVVDADPIVISTDIAVPLALIVNELVTNAVQHSRAVDRGGQVRVTLRDAPDGFSIIVIDPGEGPDTESAPHAGLGTTIVEAFARQIHATVSRERSPAGYMVALRVPRHAAPESSIC